MRFKLLLSAALFLFVHYVQAQVQKPSNAPPLFQQNFIKTNLTSIPLKNYSLQYERIINKHISAGVTYRLMPTTFIPFKSAVSNAVGNDQTTKDIVNNTQLSNFAITPEGRYYFGKGYGKGFYIAAYYRYVSFSTSQVPVNYQSNGVTQTVTLSGDLKANTGGIMFGAQWLLGKRLCLDWWILGAHYGSGNGTFVGIPARPLTTQEQQQIKQSIDDVDIPLTKKTTTVTANQVTVDLSGPFGGLRAGLSLGVRF